MKYAKCLVLCCLVWLVACANPTSKEDYLNRFEHFVERVEEYIDEDFDEDLEKLIDGSTEIGYSAVNVLEDLIPELDKSF